MVNLWLDRLEYDLIEAGMTCRQSDKHRPQDRMTCHYSFPRTRKALRNPHGPAMFLCEEPNVSDRHDPEHPMQVRHGRPALIPNSLWRNSTFLSMCVLTFTAWATVTANQYFLALVFEKVQLNGALATSLRFLPLVVTGVLANVVTGACVRWVKANILISAAVVLSAGTPLIMALANTSWPFWYAEFPAVLLSPIASDVVLTIANLAITSIFPAETHGLAGGVSNTVAQLGTSLGLNLTAILATAVTNDSSYADKSSPAALEVGYRAAFWTSFGATVSTLVVVALGLRSIGKVGAVKRD